MCFSPLASFTAAALTGAIGVVALSRTTAPRQWPLAAIPLVFAIQQFIEGLVWTQIPMAGGSVSNGLTLGFLIIAEVIWPVLAPAAVILAERDGGRRRLMLPWLLLGVAVCFYMSWGLVTRPHGASALGGHIVYATAEPHDLAIGMAYLAAVSLPMLLSRERAIAIFGAFVLTGSAIAYFTYWQAFLSVWCFFATAGSAAILAHFVRLRGRAPLAAPA